MGRFVVDAEGGGAVMVLSVLMFILDDELERMKRGNLPP